MKKNITAVLLAAASTLMLTACTIPVNLNGNTQQQPEKEIETVIVEVPVQATTESPSAQAAQAAQENSGLNTQYILPSDQRVMTEVDLSVLNEEQLKYAYAEIFARHGKIFTDANFNRYFQNTSWYVPNPGYSDNDLTALERDNANYIESYKNNKFAAPAPDTSQQQQQQQPQVVTQYVPVPVPADNYSSGDYSYIIPYSSSQKLTSADISGMTKAELRLARNEIYARHGRLFNDSSLQSYFNGKAWYNGYIAPENFKESSLSATEKYNVQFIKTTNDPNERYI